MTAISRRHCSASSRATPGSTRSPVSTASAPGSRAGAIARCRAGRPGSRRARAARHETRPRPAETPRGRIAPDRRPASRPGRSRAACPTPRSGRSAGRSSDRRAGCGPPARAASPHCAATVVGNPGWASVHGSNAMRAPVTRRHCGGRRRRRSVCGHQHCPQGEQEAASWYGHAAVGRARSGGANEPYHGPGGVSASRISATMNGWPFPCPPSRVLCCSSTLRSLRSRASRVRC